MISTLKSIFRSLYYFINNGRVIKMKGYKHLGNSKWIINTRFGMAYFKGYYEPKICNYLINNLKADSVFVDVGAHAGYFSLFSKMLVAGGGSLFL